MPNPTTLTVKVPEGTDKDKYKQALEAALWGKGGNAGFTTPRPVDCDLYITARDYSTSPPSPIPIALRSDVLDPEDAVLVARVLGAVLVTDEDYPFEHARWGKTRLIWGEDPKRVYATTDGWPPQSGWRIHSIPCLGLTR